jgi:hypothetical protein
MKRAGTCKVKAKSKSKTASSAASGSKGSSTSGKSGSSKSSPKSSSNSSSQATGASSSASSADLDGLTEFLGSNSGIGSWFRTNNGQDDTNGRSWCQLNYQDDWLGFAPDGALAVPVVRI